MNAAPVYSKICDVDKQAYLAYLIAFNNGQRFDDAGDVSGSRGDEADRCGGVDAGGGFGRARACSCGIFRQVVMDAGFVRPFVGIDGNAGGGVAVTVCGTGSEPGGVSGCDVGGVGGGVAGHGGSSGGEEASGSTGVSAAVLEVSGVPRGKHYAKNKRARARRARKRDAVPDWRKNAGPLAGHASVVVGSGRAGFFDECDAEMRKRLKESRGAALIARNQREAAEHEARVRALSSPESVFRAVAALSAAAGKASAGELAGGVAAWVKSAASASVESVVKSAVASDASLPGYSSDSSLGVESVGQGFRRPKVVGRESVVAASERVLGRRAKPGKYSLVALPAAVAERQCLGDGKVSPELLELARMRKGSILAAVDLVKSFALSKEYGLKLESLECLENDGY